MRQAPESWDVRPDQLDHFFNMVNIYFLLTLISINLTEHGY